MITQTDRLILACCSTHITDESMQQAEDLISSNIDWDYLIKQTHLQRIAPLVYYSLNIINQNRNIPNEVIEKLRKTYMDSFLNNLLLWEELKEILKMLAEQKINAIPLKGPILAKTLYDDIGLRIVEDLDILIEEKNLNKTAEKLSELGYKVNGGKTVTDSSIKDYRDLKLIKTISPTKKIFLDIQWRHTCPRTCGIEIKNIWKNAYPKEIEDIKIMTPSYEDYLLYLALHFHRHIGGLNQINLKSICDISELVKTFQIKWDIVLKDSKLYKMQTILYYSLYFAKDLLNAPVPANILERLKPHFIKRIIIDGLLSKDRIIHAHSIEIFGLPRYRNMLAYSTLSGSNQIFNRLFTPIRDFAEFYSLPFPSYRTYLLYSFRPFYLPLRVLKALIIAFSQLISFRRDTSRNK